MATEREHTNSMVSAPVVYNVGGNSFRAYFDAAHELCFVIDDTITADKPNVMLVVPEMHGRKWDDILTRDFGVDLETVRPRRDNKYQKLDIEYGALNVYADLVRAADSGDDLPAALDALARFRIESSRRAAAERLAAATDTAEKARETIGRTNESISELQSRIRELRAKLKKQRASIGREPTKQSASKILRSEAQIDTANDKLNRAKKRLASAQRRLVAAEEDAEIAREILARNHDMPATNAVAKSEEIVADIPMTSNAPVFRDINDAKSDDDDIVVDIGMTDTNDSTVAGESDGYEENTLPAAPIFTDVAMYSDAPVPDTIQPEITTEDKETIIESEPRTEEMADEKDVKPLFDKDPEILDEEIAFKPIEFDVRATDASAPRAVSPVQPVEDSIAPAPLSFVPPTRSAESDVVQNNATVTPSQDMMPVLDTITSVDAPNMEETIVRETFIPQPVPEPAPAAPVQPAYQPEPAPAATPVPDVAPAPVGSSFRPVSPIRRKESTAAAPVDPAAKKPTLIYYLMLILLIVLSVFTLWFYQKSTRDTTPDLAATAAPQVAAENAVAKSDAVSAKPFIEPEVPVAAPEPVVINEVEIVETITEPEPEPIPVVAMPEPEAESVPVVVAPSPEPVVQETPASPFLPIEPVAEPKPVIPTAEEILATKPAYNVSQQEKMFVADENYETDMVYSEDSDYGDDGYFDAYATEYSFATEPVAPQAMDEEVTCSNGGAPDMYGCCPGEEYTDMGPDGYFCCAGDDCYPPLF